MKRWVLWMATVIVAGCATVDDSGEPNLPPANPTPGPAPNTNDTPLPEITMPDASSMEWTGCEAWGAGHDWPGGAQHAEHPPGWDPPHDGATYIQLSGWNCKRIHWGAFERGPVSVIMEKHNRLTVPESCYPELSTVETSLAFRVLNSIWFNDTEIARFAKEAYGMPAYYSEITESQEATPLGPMRTMSWGLPGAPNEIGVLHYSNTQTSPVPDYEYMMWWFNDTGVSFLDADFTKDTPNINEPRFGHGSFSDPILLSKWPMDHYFLDEWFGPSSAELRLGQFLDFQCKKPVPS